MADTVTDPWGVPRVEFTIVKGIQMLTSASAASVSFGRQVPCLVVGVVAVATLWCVPVARAQQGAPHEELANSLTLHASFDTIPDADFALGDKRLFTAPSYTDLARAQPGLHAPDVAIAAGKGRYGSALEFTSKNTAAIYFRAEKNIGYRQRGWSGTVSFWLSLDPDEDLAPGYCDPIQITDTQYNDAALWVDFSRDERPRHFRLGVFGDLLSWNPEQLGPDDNADFTRRLITLTTPPFQRGTWTHVVFTFSGLNAQRPGDARLYLNGRLQGTTEPIGEPFTWDISRATIRLGLNYTGLYDDLSLFNRALNDQEVQILHGLDRGVASLRP